MRGCDVRITGKVIRFDAVRGYGFISPDVGGEDVFLHVNDLEFEKPLARAGARVSFEILDGDRGKFATAVRLATKAATANATSTHEVDSVDESDDYYDVLSAAEFRHLVTEILLQISPSIAGDQIIAVRSEFEKLARKQGWIDH
jgi:cold shock protein